MNIMEHPAKVYARVAVYLNFLQQTDAEGITHKNLGNPLIEQRKWTRPECHNIFWQNNSIFSKNLERMISSRCVFLSMEQRLNISTILFILHLQVITVAWRRWLAPCGPCAWSAWRAWPLGFGRSTIRHG